MCRTIFRRLPQYKPTEYFGAFATTVCTMRTYSFRGELGCRELRQSNAHLPISGEAYSDTVRNFSGLR